MLLVAHCQLWACQLAVDNAVVMYGTQEVLPPVIRQHSFLERSQLCWKLLEARYRLNSVGLLVVHA